MTKGETSSASRRKRLGTLNSLAQSLQDSRELLKRDEKDDEDNILNTMAKALGMKKKKKAEE